ncbi:MAG: hypothetical protein CL878_02770 [Dehalococcoidia bacterium]|nr:hypothetical protein [Dehalococcoidia bacterium]
MLMGAPKRRGIAKVTDESRASNAPGILLIICVAIFFGVLNASALGVVLPDIARDLSVDTGQLSWLMTGFLLVYGIAIPFYGRLADLYGARPLFLIGVAIFSVGSLLSAVAPTFSLLLAARIVQAAGGAAVPGLGMTLASRAYGAGARGTVLGVLAATIGVGGAMGPLLGGALSDSLGWQSIFVVSAVAALTIPVGLRILPRDEPRTGGNLDLLGGVALALMVTGALLIPSEGSRSGWSSPLVLSGAVMAIVGIVALSARQLTADSPFIPREFLRNLRYVALLGMGSSASAASLAPLVGLPILLATLHSLSPLEVGLTMLPGAIASSLFGVLAGRLTDRAGPRLPAWMGSPLILLAVLGLSTSSGSSVWVVATFAGILGAGSGLMNTPVAATIPRIVGSRVLASALSINSMAFFLGGGFGTAALMAVVTSRGQGGLSSVNPLHSGAGTAYSDAFLLLAVPVLVAMALSLALPGAARPAAEPRPVEVEPAPVVSRNWVDNCSVPWTPECEEAKAGHSESVAPAIEAEYART